MQLKTRMNYFFKRVFIILLAISIIDFSPLVAAQDMSMDDYLNTNIEEVNSEYAKHQLTINLQIDQNSVSKIIEFTEHSTIKINANSGYEIISISNNGETVELPYQLGTQDVILDIAMRVTPKQTDPIGPITSSDPSENPVITQQPIISESPTTTDLPVETNSIFSVLSINKIQGKGTLEEPFVVDKDIDYIFKITTDSKNAYRLINQEEDISINDNGEFFVKNPLYSVLTLQENINQQWVDNFNIYFTTEILPRSLEIKTRTTPKMAKAVMFSNVEEAQSSSNAVESTQLYANEIPEYASDELPSWGNEAVFSSVEDPQPIMQEVEPIQLYADVLPEDSSDKAVTWEIVDGSEFATINETGLLTPIANGDVTVKATSVANPLVSNQATFAVTATTLYRVTWNYNGGTGSPAYNDVPYYTYAQTIIPSVIPTRSGYIFDGWYQDINFTRPVDANTIVYNNVTFYAKWYTVPEAPLPPATNTSGLKPGEVSASKTASWVSKVDNIGRIDFTLQGMPTKKGSDIIIILDKSGSMQGTRWTSANNAVSTLANDLFKNSNEFNNRVALVKFSDNISGSFNFKNSKTSFDAANASTAAAGGTYYSLALKEAITYAKSRSEAEKERPLYVIFISDGAPTTGYVGESELTTLKGIVNRIYSVGIQMASSDTAATTQLNKIVYNGTYTNVVNMSDLNGVLSAIRGSISIAASNAKIEDIISSDYEIINTSTYPLPNNSTINGQTVNINVGDITETPKVYSIYIKLKDPLKTGSIPTNTSAKLTYKDVNGNPASKDQNIMGSPSLPNSTGAIDISYYRVNESGKYITEDGSVLADSQKPFAKIGTTEAFLFNNSSSLVLNKTYSVSATIPNGYSIYAGDSAVKDILVTDTNPLAAVEFKCVKNPTYSATWKNDDGTILYAMNNLKKDDVPTYNQTPTKLPSAEYTFVFSGWVDQDGKVYISNSFDAISKNMVYTAKYDAIKRQYPVNVLFVDEDNNVAIKTQYTTMLDYGSLFDYKNVGYIIDGYTKTNDPTPITITNANNQIVLYYSMDKIGKNGGLNGGDGIPDKYQIKVNYNIINGTFVGPYGPYVLTKLENGNPSKTGSASLSESQIANGVPYTNFENPSWNTVPTTTLTLTSDTTFVLSYSPIPTFTVRWLDDGGNVLDINYNVLRDTTVTSSLTPIKNSDIQYDYTFNGWSPIVGPITKNTDYIAQYTKTLKNYDYQVKYLDKFNGTELLNGEIKTATYGDIINVKTLQKDITNYIYIDASNENTTIDGPSKVISLYYAKDVIGNNGGISGGDGIPDAYQIIVSFDILNGTWLPDQLTADRVFTLKNNEGNPALASDGGVYLFDRSTLPTSEPNTNYENGQWVNLPDDPIILNGNKTFSYTYGAIPKYTVTWKNADGSILEIDNDVLRGTTPSYDSITPLKKQTDAEYYVFDGWLDKDNNPISAVYKDVEYIAQFKPIKKYFNYTVKYVDLSNNMSLKDDEIYNVAYDAKINSDQYIKVFNNYVFNSVDPVEINVKDNSSQIIVKYDKDAIGKDGGINGGDGIADKYQAIVDFKVLNGQFTDYKGPQVVTKYTDSQLDINGSGLLKDNQIPHGIANQYYENGKWDNDPLNTTINQNIIFTLSYEAIPRFNINWINDDGSTLEIDKNVLRGEMPSYDGLIPTKAMDAENTYVFAGWDKEVSAVTKDETYKAKYTVIPRLYEYKVLFQDYKTGELIADSITSYAPYNKEIDHLSYIKSIDGYAFISGDNTIIDGDNKKVILKYGKDIIGKDGGINGSDGIADMFQIIIDYHIINGSFVGNVGPFVLTLKDDNQKISLDGYAYLSDNQIPTPIPEIGYEGYWYYVPNTYTKLFADTTYIYSAGNLIECNIIFKNDDGTTLQEGITLYGYTPIYNGLTPTKNSNDQYDYQFIGWDKTITPATGDKTYTAVYSQTDRMYDYVVKYIDEDNSIDLSDDLRLQTTYHNTINAANYVKNIPNYAYTNNSGNIQVDNEHKEIKIFYSKDMIGFNESLHGSDGIPDKYQVTLSYQVNNGAFTSESGPFVVTLKDENGNFSKNGTFTITSKYIPLAQPYPNYENGTWSPTLGIGTKVSSDMNYVLNYSAIPTFTVKWVNDDQTLLEEDTSVLRDSMAAYNGNTPYKAPTAQFTYIFDGWDKPITYVTNDITYTAKYREVLNNYDYLIKYRDIENAQTLVTDKMFNAAYGTTINYQNYLLMIKDYIFVSADKDMTIQGNNQSLTLNYAKDVIGKDGGINGGDGIPDMYQVKVYFECIDGTFTNYNGPYVLTLHDDNGKLAKASEGGKVLIPDAIIPLANPNDGFQKGSWDVDPKGQTITQDSGYTYWYAKIPTFTVNWKNGDLKLEEDLDVRQGTIPTFNGITAVKDADYQYNYVFDAWNTKEDGTGNPVTPVNGDTTYYAQFIKVDKYYGYTVKFVDYDTKMNIKDGFYDLTYTNTVLHDATIIADNYIKEIPNYAYVANNGNITFKPDDNGKMPAEITLYYSVDEIGKDGGVNGSDGIPDKYQAKISYDIVNGQFTTSSEPKVVTLLKDGKPALKGEGSFTLNQNFIPQSMPNYGYENGVWDNGLADGLLIKNDIKFTITYQAIPEYKVRFVNYNDEDLVDPQILMRDTIVDYKGPTPIKPDDIANSYVFIGWDKTIVPVSDNVIYKAVYNSVLKNYPYYIKYVDYFSQDDLYPWLSSNDQANVDKGFIAPYLSTIDLNKHKTLIDGYVFVDADKDNVVKDTKTVSNLYYAKDIIGKDGGINGGDGIPDAYQVMVDFSCNNGTMTNYKGIKVLNLYDDKGNLALASSGGLATIPSADIPIFAPNHGYDDGDWVSDNPRINSQINTNKTFIYSYGEIEKFNVKWLNYDNEVLKNLDNVYKGDTVYYDLKTPTRPISNGQEYIFTGWSPVEGPIVDDTIYIAQYLVREIEYSFMVDHNLVDAKGNQTLIISEAHSARYNDIVDAKDYLRSFDGYTFVSSSGKHTITDNSQRPQAFYAVDVIGKDGTLNGGDGVADMYQIVVGFNVVNGIFNNYNGPYVLTLKDDKGELALAKDGGYAYLSANQIPNGLPNSGFNNGTWNENPSTDIKLTSNKDYVLTYHKIVDDGNSNSNSNSIISKTQDSSNILMFIGALLISLVSLLLLFVNKTKKNK